VTYAEALAYLDSLQPSVVRLGLERIERLCARAGHPERQFPAVLIGGTNGKGSTAAFLAHIFQAAGRRVGMAPKPHLITPRERLQIDGRLVSEAEFAALTASVRPLVEAVAADPAAGQPTYFEVMTLLAFLWFARERIERGVIEVGLGGRFDATNVLPAELCIITDVGLDHMDRLGETIPQIAFEKAGIVKPQGRLVTGASGDAWPVIERVAAERGSAVWRLGEEIRIENAHVTATGSDFAVRMPLGAVAGLHTEMLGEHQVRNAALAVAAALWLRDRDPAVTDDAIRTGVAATRVPGRLQRVRAQPDVYLDAAHNGDKARALAATLRDLLLPARPGRRLYLILGVTRAHAVAPLLAALAPLATTVIATTNRHPQAYTPAELAELLRPTGVRVLMAPTPRAALELALGEASPRDLVCVTGSFFTIAELAVTAEGDTGDSPPTPEPPKV